MTNPQSTAEVETRSAAVTITDLHKSFETLDQRVVAADGISLDIEPGSLTALMGPSGSGKSTLLHLIGALDAPDSGSIEVFGTDITRLNRREAARYRRSIGFVFQQFNLLPTLTVLDNVLAPLMPFHPGREDKQRAHHLLAAVGLEGREQTLATRLSGGQQQRVAIARALIAQPKLVLADEPTGNLDSATGEEVIRLLFDLRARLDTTLVIATHDPGLADRCDRTVHLKDGRVI